MSIDNQFLHPEEQTPDQDQEQAAHPEENILKIRVYPYEEGQTFDNTGHLSLTMYTHQDGIAQVKTGQRPEQVELELHNPLTISVDEWRTQWGWGNAPQALIAKAIEEGHDGLIIKADVEAEEARKQEGRNETEYTFKTDTYAKFENAG